MKKALFTLYAKEQTSRGSRRFSFDWLLFIFLTIVIVSLVVIIAR